MLTIIQIILLALIALLGIPTGFILKRATMEEMKAGKKWFKMISSISLLSAIISVILANDNSALYVTTFMFLFFISSVPLIKFKKKK